VERVKDWVNSVVVEWNLCPFARKEVVENKIRYFHSSAQSEDELLADLACEIALLDHSPSVSTTLLIHPQVLNDFENYNQFLEDADALLAALGKEGTYQIASFHPRYRFHGTREEAAENYTNRSPYPLLHILRESMVEQAVERHPDPEGIPERNIRLLQEMDKNRLESAFPWCKESR